jgi:hypothetical protein
MNKVKIEKVENKQCIFAPVVEDWTKHKNPRQYKIYDTHVKKEQKESLKYSSYR